MRILLTCDPMIPVPPTGYGGIERIVERLARELRQRGHRIGLVAKAGSTCDVDCLETWPGDRMRHPLDTFRNGWTLLRIARRFQPDVIHSFSRLAYLVPAFGALRHVPKIMSYQRHPDPAQIRRARLLAGGSLRFTGCSEFICAMGRRAGGQWQTIPNFIDPAQIVFAAEVPGDAPLLFLSRIESIKGPDLAIAIARHARRRLIIAGNRATTGPESVFFQQKVEPHLGRDGIEWIGEVDDAAKNRLLGQCAALLVPIRWDEPFGIVFAEALAAGTPVVTCRRGAAPEIVRPGLTGFFVSDVEQGVEAVRRVSELDRTACRRDAEQRFSVGACADQYLHLYRERLTGLGAE